jgi:hypothetical protein
MKFVCDYCDSGKYGKGIPCKRDKDSDITFENPFCGFGNLEGLEVAQNNGEIEFRDTGRKVKRNSRLKLFYAIVEAEEQLKEKGITPREKPETSILCGLYNMTPEQVKEEKERMLKIYNNIKLKKLPPIPKDTTN